MGREPGPHKGVAAGCVLLSWQKQLGETSRVDVAEERCARRQQRGRQEVRIKGVRARTRRVDQVVYAPVLVQTSSLAIVVHADHRTLIINILTAPVFEVSQEVVRSAVGTEVIGHGVARGLWE